MDDSTRNVWDIALGLLQFSAVVFGALWVYFRFRQERPNRPRIAFTLDCNFFGPVQGDYAAAFEIRASNEGNVEHRFTEIRLRVLGISRDEPLEYWKEHEPRLRFPHKVTEARDLVPTEFKYYFVRPGVVQTFSFVTKVPVRYRFLLARATFKYANGDLHTAERVFEVRHLIEAGPVA